jgi:hypothetical protein
MAVAVTPVENRLSLDLPNAPSVSVGWDAVRAVLEPAFRAAKARSRKTWIALDGYAGTDWTTVRSEVERLARARHVRCRFVDVASCRRGTAEIDRLVAPCLPSGDPIFGRLYRGTLSAFFDASELKAIADSARSSPEPMVVCYGTGATLLRPRRVLDLVLWFDLTREEVLSRNKAWVGRRSKTQNISPRRIYYVDFPVHDRHRARVLLRATHYVDANDAARPRIISRPDLHRLLRELLRSPLRVKPLYEPEVWGGQWLIRNRKIPGRLPNCAYGLEIIAPEQSVLVEADGTVLEIPFTLVVETESKLVMTERTCARFGRFFPIRLSYDDTWGGGNLSIQVHPTTAYARRRFGEPLHQAEMYYLFEAKNGSRVHLGLRDGIDVEEFRRRAMESEARRDRFEHLRYVNTVAARKGEILLVPPGTVHGSGADELVLEIGSTPYRYTFKIYDYRRPDLDGGFRPLSLDHAFRVLKPSRTERWVRANLTPTPRTLRSGPGWHEEVIADSPFFHHVVHRVAFRDSYRDDTNGTFHLLNLVEGNRISIEPVRRGGVERPLALSESVLVPAAVGAYRVRNLGTRPCRIVKVFPRTGA